MRHRMSRRSTRANPILALQFNLLAQLSSFYSRRPDMRLLPISGVAWLTSARSALLRVPSALIPNVANYLVNPLHPDARRLSIQSVARYPFDPRLFKHK